MSRKTSKVFKELLESLPGNSLYEDMWIIYSEGYNDASVNCPNCKTELSHSSFCNKCGLDIIDYKIEKQKG